MRTVLFIMILAAPATAGADAEEASLQLEAGPAILRSGPSTRPGGLASLRLGYGLRDWLTAEVLVGAAAAEALEHAAEATGAGPGIIHHDLRAARATIGATARLGARWIPTLSLGFGYQRRWLTGGALIDERRHLIASLPPGGADDLLLLAAAGVELRLGRRLVVGVSAQLVHGFPIGGPRFASFELPLRLGWSWYPGWFRGPSTERLDD